MNKRNNISIMLRFQVEYINTLRRVRKRVKGMQLSSIQAIDLLGEYPNGIRVCEIFKDAYEQQLLRAMFARERKRGYVTKVGPLYSLTDKGQTAYQALYNETKVLRNNIINTVTKDVQKRLHNTPV